MKLRNSKRKELIDKKRESLTEKLKRLELSDDFSDIHPGLSCSYTPIVSTLSLTYSLGR